MSKEITGALFKQMILHGAAAITAQKQAINDLNVFPVPVDIINVFGLHFCIFQSIKHH